MQQRGWLVLFIDKKTVQQAAALPLICIENDIRILLITSRRRKRWILPKGWPKKNTSLAETAAAEAREEAGVIGPVGREPIGSYQYQKQMNQGYRIPCQVFVYSLLVRQQLIDWPEKAERDFSWMTPTAAVDQLHNKQLVALLRSRAAKNSEYFHQIVWDLEKMEEENRNLGAGTEAVAPLQRPAANKV